MKSNNFLKRKIRDIKGISFLECCVFLIVFFLVSSYMARYYAAKLENKSYKVTIKHMDVIEHAIKNYVLNHKNLPCVSSTDHNIMLAKFGEELDCKNDANVLKIDIASNNEYEQICTGNVPVKGLGIRDEYALDGWGRQIDYMVICDLTQGNNLHNYVTDNVDGIIRVIGENNRNLSSTPIAYALISHGKKGNGARLRSSEILSACDTSLDDGENCNNDATIIDKEKTPTFDNVVSWKLLDSVKSYFGEAIVASPDKGQNIPPHYYVKFMSQTEENSGVREDIAGHHLYVNGDLDGIKNHSSFSSIKNKMNRNALVNIKSNGDVEFVANITRPGTLVTYTDFNATFEYLGNKFWKFVVSDVSLNAKQLDYVGFFSIIPEIIEVYWDSSASTAQTVTLRALTTIGTIQSNAATNITVAFFNDIIQNNSHYVSANLDWLKYIDIDISNLGLYHVGLTAIRFRNSNNTFTALLLPVTMPLEIISSDASVADTSQIIDIDNNAVSTFEHKYYRLEKQSGGEHYRFVEKTLNYFTWD